MSVTKTVLDWLIAEFPQAKKTTLRDMIEQKKVTLNGVAVKSLKQTVAEGDKIVAAGAIGPVGKAVTLEERIRVVFSDSDVVVVEKPAGVLTSTHEDEQRPTTVGIVNEYVARQNHKNRAFLVHRLDKDASGLLVFARSDAALKNLKQQFLDHTIERKYHVVVHGQLTKKSGKLEHILAEDDRGLVRVVQDLRVGRHAVLDYKVLAAGEAVSLVECTLYTGRKHQIRVQMRALGHAVCGDPIYGNKAAKKGDDPPGRLALHAVKLAFDHPRTKQRMTFEDHAPDSFSHMVKDAVKG